MCTQQRCSRVVGQISPAVFQKPSGDLLLDVKRRGLDVRSELKARMLGEKISDIGLYSLGQQRARTVPQDFGELIVKASWLSQFENGIVEY